jgi:hypothetical protein
MDFQQMPEFTDRGFIRHRLAAQIIPTNCRKARESYQASSTGLIRQVELLLQTMEAQHAFNAHRRPP